MTDSPPAITVYTANSPSRGLVRSAAASFRDVYVSRHLIWRLFLRDFKAQFRQNVLGYTWAVLTPILGVFSFIYLNYAGILNPGTTDVPYPLYVFVGTSIWGFLVNTVTLMSGGLRSQSELIMRTNIPKIALAASSCASIGYGVVVNLIMIVAALVAFQMPLHWEVLAFPLLIVPIIALGIGLGLVISVMGIIAKDLGAIAGQILTILMYLTPVVFLSDHISSPVLHRMILDNPLTYLVDLPRSVLLGRGSFYWWEYFGASALAFAMLIVGIKVFQTIQDLVAERL